MMPINFGPCKLSANDLGILIFSQTPTACSRPRPRTGALVYGSYHQAALVLNWLSGKPFQWFLRHA